MLAVSHALPIRYVLDAADGLFPAARIAHVPHATPLALDADGRRTRSRDAARVGYGTAVRRRRLSGRGRPARPCTAHCPGGRARSHRGTRAGRGARPAGRRGRSASSPGGADSTCLWHALGALGYRVRAVHVHHGSAGRRGGRRRRALRDGARRGGRPRRRRRRPRRACASSGTAPPRGSGCARPATRPPTRSRRCSSGSSRAARPAGSGRAGPTASCGRSCPSGGRRPRRTAPRTACRTRSDSTNGDTKRGPDP